MLEPASISSKVVVLLSSMVGYQVWICILLLLFGCALGLPIPEELIILLSGSLVAAGRLSWVEAYSACVIGVLAGDILLFVAGKFFKNVLVNWLIEKDWLKPAKLIWAQELFEKYGTFVLIIGRFTPGTRTPIFLFAGIMQMSFVRFLIVDGVASLIFTPIWLVIGFYMKGSAEVLFNDNKGILIVCGALGVIALYYFSRRAKRV